MYLTGSVEDIGHDYEVDSVDISIFSIFDFVQPKEPCDKSLRVANNVLIVRLQNKFQPLKLSMTYSFEHIFGVISIIEERSTLTS